MKKYFRCSPSAWLIAGFFFLATGKAFSQANERADKMDTSSSASVKTDGSPRYVTGITPGRAKSLVGTVAGLISLVAGWRAKLRSNKNTGSGRTASIVALVLGLISIVLSIIHLSITYGATFGSGSGKAGSIVALVLAVIGMTLGGLALRRIRKGDGVIK